MPGFTDQPVHEVGARAFSHRMTITSGAPWGCPTLVMKAETDRLDLPSKPGLFVGLQSQLRERS
jgi:hypothetical protein